VKPSLKVTEATGTSPFIESGAPTTVASATARKVMEVEVIETDAELTVELLSRIFA
jgi:hypothetical protein